MPRLEIEVHGPLMVGGGHAATLGVDATTARRFHQGLWVPYLPATALRGAVRQQLEALLAGAGETASGPYPFAEGNDGGDRPDDPVAEIFGYSGPAGRRSGAREGRVRFGDGMPEEPEEAVARLSVRPGVALDDHRGSAEDRKLFFRELAEVGAAPLRFVADLRVRDLSAELERMLRAAVATTTALGAAKASGGGRVRMVWREESGGGPSTRVSGEPATARRARVTLTCREPLHLGDGGPLGNYHGTRTHIPGATLRGAVAWALLRAGLTTPESAGFRALFLDESAPVSFGDALAVRPGGDSDSPPPPRVVPSTRRHTRSPGGRRRVDLLAGELARERVNRRLEREGSGVYLQAAAGDRKLDAVPPRPAPGLLRRVRTRVSIDRHSGTAADGRLFSIEQVEADALVADGEGGVAWGPVRFVATVEGLRKEAAALLSELDGVPLLVGGRRNHGLGAVEADVELLPEGEPEVDAARERVDALDREVQRLEADLGERAGLSEAGEPVDAVCLALTAVSDFVPEEDDDHPLRSLAPEVGAPVRRFLVPGFSGGYDQRQSGRRGADAEPLKTLHPAAGAGSVYVYGVERGALDGLLAAVLPRLAEGVGRRRESGCGRFEVFRPLRRSGDGPRRPQPREESS